MEKARIDGEPATVPASSLVAAMRLRAQLARNIEKTAELQADRARIEAKLVAIETELAAEGEGVAGGEA